MDCTEHVQDLDVVERQLRDFIVSYGCPPSVAWTFFEDYLWIAQVLYVNPSRLPTNRDLVTEALRSERAASLGVEVNVVAVSAGVSMCTIWIPHSFEDAELRLISGLKFRVPYRLVRCVTVESVSAWQRLESRIDRTLPTPVDELMRRDAHLGESRTAGS